MTVEESTYLVGMLEVSTIVFGLIDVVPMAYAYIPGSLGEDCFFTALVLGIIASILFVSLSIFNVIPNDGTGKKISLVFHSIVGIFIFMSAVVMCSQLNRYRPTTERNQFHYDSKYANRVTVVIVAFINSFIFFIISISKIRLLLR